MKNFFFYLALVLFLQNFNNLDGMPHFGVGHAPCCHIDEYAQLRFDIEQEAEKAASLVNYWFYSEKIIDTLCVSNEIDAWIIDKDKLGNLTIGQQTVLTCWAARPQFMLKVFSCLGSEYPSHINFRDALIRYNFGDAFFKKYKNFLTKKNLSCWVFLPKFLKVIPYLKYLKTRLSCMTNYEIEEEITKCHQDIKETYPELGAIDLHDHLFLLQNPYFFMNHIFAWSDQNCKFDNWELIYTDEGCKIIELFLEYGFDVNCQLREGCDDRDTLLHRAVRYDDINMVEVLLKWRADPLICYGREQDPSKRHNGGGQSPWDISCYKMRGDTCIRPIRPPTEKTQKIHEMLSCVVPKHVLEGTEDSLGIHHGRIIL